MNLIVPTGLILLAFTPLVLAGELVECDTDSTSTYQMGDTTSTAWDYTSDYDAARAASQGLKDKMVGASGAECDDEGCEPTSCVPLIRCLDENCSNHIHGSPVQDPQTGLWMCTDTWTEGEYKVYCTPCD